MTARPDLVCADCGAQVTRRPDGAVFHIEAIPEGFEYHAPRPVPEASMPEPDDTPSPGMRQTTALERIADALEAMLEFARTSGR